VFRVVGPPPFLDKNAEGAKVVEAHVRPEAIAQHAPGVGTSGAR